IGIVADGGSADEIRIGECLVAYAQQRMPGVSAQEAEQRLPARDASGEDRVGRFEKVLERVEKANPGHGCEGWECGQENRTCTRAQCDAADRQTPPTDTVAVQPEENE